MRNSLPLSCVPDASKNPFRDLPKESVDRAIRLLTQSLKAEGLPPKKHRLLLTRR